MGVPFSVMQQVTNPIVTCEKLTGLRPAPMEVLCVLCCVLALDVRAPTLGMLPGLMGAEGAEEMQS